MDVELSGTLGVAQRVADGSARAVAGSAIATVAVVVYTTVAFFILLARSGFVD